MGNNIAAPPPPPPLQETETNADFSGEIWVAGKADPISPRVAASLGEPWDGPEEGCPSGRSFGQMVRRHHPGEIRTYDQGWPA